MMSVTVTADQLRHYTYIAGTGASLCDVNAAIIYTSPFVIPQEYT
ncbi:hypothetical protein MTBPR1_60111 [Candidatus Terasakiella magnetica]|uniref:Uncharacterized protein n=1 Tax=Candidatus Terasakiella magnetica TaxID=1867952 RepID=A0A1C3RJZ5_9PROT|nr:hypothetical protein MTBPR1_60111 [Candidatus Terasakiella magnetica]